MSTRCPPKRLHPAWATLLALGLHAALLVGVRSTRPQAASRAPRVVDAELELSLDTEVAEPVSAGQGTLDSAAQLAASGKAPAISEKTASEKKLRRSPSTRAPTTPSAALPADGMVSSKDQEEPAGDAAVVALAPTAHPIDLGLNGGVRRAALSEGWVANPATPNVVCDGGLAAGLVALDAQRGQSRSNAANAASYEAARRFAPPSGMGIFDIVADERGVVLSVTLASAPADEARWQRVGQELDALLKERRFRVPPGAKGLAARLRIETGELARDLAEHVRTRRGAALGQAPGGTREARDESTRARLEPGQLSPTLGVTVAGGGSDSHIRVVLLSERPL